MALPTLVGVDTRRISRFLSVQLQGIGNVVQLGFSIVVLYHLIGLWPTAAGIAAWCIVIPFTMLLAKRNSSLQSAWMRSRDSKLSLGSPDGHRLVTQCVLS